VHAFCTAVMRICITNPSPVPRMSMKNQGEFGGGDANVPNNRADRHHRSAQDRERTVTPTLGDELTGDDRGDQNRPSSVARRKPELVGVAPDVLKVERKKGQAPNIAKPTTKPIPRPRRRHGSRKVEAPGRLTRAPLDHDEDDRGHQTPTSSVIDFQPSHARESRERSEENRAEAESVNTMMPA